MTNGTIICEDTMIMTLKSDIRVKSFVLMANTISQFTLFWQNAKMGKENTQSVWSCMEDLKRAILVSVDTEANEDDNKHKEMKELIKACEMEPIAVVLQALSVPNPATYLGSGKLSELSQLVKTMEADTVVFEDTLSPAQLSNISDAVDAEILDRTGLILKIFESRARTREAKLQVESANLSYMLPRLVGMRKNLGRQGGASGSLSNKGQGEKQIELDRRHIEKRMAELRRELESVSQTRDVQRKARERSRIPSVSMVGYTNAGKSTLMNYLVRLSGKDEKEVFEKDMLFATLDTSVRLITTGDHKDFLFTDTVGFLSDLPHGLIKAFRSTLEEVHYADLLLIVTDASDPDYREKIAVTEETLKEIHAEKLPRIYVMNKADCLETVPENKTFPDRIYISAKTGMGMDALLCKIREKVYADNETLTLLIPYSDGAAFSLAKENGNVLSIEYLGEGTKLVVDSPKWLAGKVKKYVMSESGPDTPTE